MKQYLKLLSFTLLLMIAGSNFIAMADFNPAYNVTFGHEVGFHKGYDGLDKGGMTFNGIARKHWPKWRGWIIIDDLIKRFPNLSHGKWLNEEDARSFKRLDELTREFYKQNFWDPANLNDLPNQAIANEIFDTGVNQGLETSVKYFQQSLNLLNRNQKDYPDINDDGDLGPVTLRTFKSYMYTATNSRYRSVQKNESTLLKAMNGIQFMRYHNIALREKEQEFWFYGWLNRV